MKHSLSLLALFLTLISLLLFSSSTRSASPLPQSTSEAEIEAALNNAIARHREEIVAFLIFDIKISRIQFDQTGQWAVVWLDLYDPGTGELIPTEPGLVVAQYEGDQWNILLQADPSWAAALTALPPDLMPEENKAFWLSRQSQAQVSAPSAALEGYLLPWAEGLKKILTRSISHGGTGYYAFDFADGTMFPIYASRGGTVHLVEWTYPNGFDDGSCAHSNYIILKDETTTPTTYQLYLHLAFDSIPEELRTVGAPVVRGQYLGDADDTGCSTGHHLHFHVHTNPYSYWGTALDIVFDDVAINGGRPRTKNEALSPDCTPSPCEYYSDNKFTSQNTITDDVTPPTGGLLDPNLGDLITTPTLTLSGWAFDEGSGLESAYFMAYYNDAWMQVGPIISSNILPSYNWDWCADNVPDGPVSLALHVEDEVGNVADYLGILHVLKQHACISPPPACTPALNQVALFTEAVYGGNCTTLGPGPHLISFGEAGLNASLLTGDENLAPAGGSTVSSILVGGDARVTLYRELTFQGRAQTFYASDPNLSDDWIGTQSVTLALIETDSDDASAPLPAWPSGETFTDTASLSLVWDDGGGAVDFQGRYTLDGTTTITSPWQSEPVWHLGSLDGGNYSWEVRARNSMTTTWSSPASFTVENSNVTLLSTNTTLYTETFESSANGWMSSGLWNLLNDSSATHDGSNFAWWYGAPPFASGTYDTGAPNTGDLTSPPIFLPGTGYYLRFWSWQDTEYGKNWDQRWVQISEGNRPFTNTFQMFDEPANTWVQSPFIDLSPYAGKTIRIRFHFETLDARDNAHKGWLIDDVTINNTEPPTCPPDGSSSLTYEDIVSGFICPPGDVDIFTFSGSAGDRVVVNVDAQTAGSNLDPYLFLLADDNASILAENDDEVPSVLIDPLLHFTLPWSGDYSLKLRAWNHPGAGDGTHFYTMRLVLDPDPPTISALTPTGSPTTHFFVQVDTIMDVAADVTDSVGMERVEFWWHSGDWVNDEWEMLGMDTDGLDGWSLPGGWDTTPLPDQSGMAIYIRAVDRAGNAAFKGAWNLALDSVPPQTTVVGLPPVRDSTAMLLEWNSTDNVASIREFDIQWNVDGAGWTLYQGALISSTRQLWVIGELGSLYGFRVRAVDGAGNKEFFDGPNNQTTTFIEPCDEPDPWDAGGNDDSSFTFASVFTGTQTHNFCDTGDEDWVQLVLEGGTSYFISTTPLDPSSAAVVELYAEDGSTQLVRVFPQDPNGNPTSGMDSFGLPTLMIFSPPTSGTYYLRLFHPVSGVAGSAVGYILNMSSHQVFLPVIVR